VKAQRGRGYGSEGRGGKREKTYLNGAQNPQKSGMFREKKSDQREGKETEEEGRQDGLEMRLGIPQRQHRNASDKHH